MGGSVTSLAPEREPRRPLGPLLAQAPVLAARELLRSTAEALRVLEDAEDEDEDGVEFLQDWRRRPDCEEVAGSGVETL